MNRAPTSLFVFLFLAARPSLGEAEQESAAEAEEARPELGPVVSLGDALRMADRENLGVRAAHQQIDRASGSLRRAWSALLPHASVQAQYLILDEERTADFGGAPLVLQPQTNLSGTASVALPLFHMDAYPNLENARAGREAARLGERETRRRVHLAIARAYYGILSAHRYRELQVRARANAVAHLENAQARFQAGVGLRLDVTRAALQVEEAEAAIIAADAAEQDAYDALSVLINHPLPFHVAEPGATPRPSEPVERLVDSALRHRSDVRIAELERDMAERDTRAAWYALLPALDAAWNVNYSEFVSQFGGADTLSWNIALVLNVPIYDGGQRYGAIDERRALLRAAELRAEEVRQGASLEVRSAFRGWQTSVARVQTSERRVALAREVLELAEAAYEAGAATNLEVVDAQRQARDAEAALLVAAYDSQVALANLLLSAGRPLR